eukprot:9468345-Pyramimonas_sp.AAC.1
MLNVYPGQTSTDCHAASRKHTTLGTTGPRLWNFLCVLGVGCQDGFGYLEASLEASPRLACNNSDCSFNLTE